mgnify:CR=1 FL=1
MCQNIKQQGFQDSQGRGGIVFDIIRPLRENPIPVPREKSISHSSTSSNEENLLSSGSKSNSAAAANLVDPYSLISKTSASEFRKNNDSISSNTTNEDIDEDEDFNYCDSNEQQVRKLYKFLFQSLS